MVLSGRVEILGRARSSPSPDRPTFRDDGAAPAMGLSVG